MSDIVSAEWLMLNLEKVRVVDASWYMPADKRGAKAEFEAAHIPGAQLAIFENSGHGPMSEENEAFIARVRDFLGMAHEPSTIVG